MMQNGIGFSLLAALSLGIADLFIQKTSRIESSIKTLFFSQFMGAIILAVYLFFSDSSFIIKSISLYGGITLIIGIILALGNLFLFRAFELGPLLIVSPITSSFAVVTMVLSFLFGEKTTLIQNLGLLVTIAGIVLGGIKRSDDLINRPHLYLPQGIRYAILAAILFGIGFWLLRYPSPILGSFLTTFIARFSSIVTISIIMICKKNELRIRSNESIIPILIIGILNACGLILYNQALIYGLSSIVTVIFSLYGVVTVIIGYIFLKQRVFHIQYMGILLTFIGVAILSFG
jgi:drug/metabolite transporter (DMT)-like permease